MDVELQQLASSVVSRVRALEGENARLRAECERQLANNLTLQSVNFALRDTVSELQAAIKVCRS